MEDRNGWLCSIYQIRDQEQDFTIPSATITFQDFPNGTGQQNLIGGTQLPVSTALLPLPVTVYNVTMSHSISTWGVETLYVHRFRTCHDGGTFEFFAGPRYIYFEDDFGIVTGTSSSADAHDYLGGTSWTSTAENNVIAGELGGRWFKKEGRWMFNVEGRFLAGLNVQNIHQNVNFGPNLLEPNSPFRPTPNPPETGTLFNPWILAPENPVYSATAYTWTPGIELRLEARYQITRCISFHAGWTGLWLDGIARGDALIDYSIAQNSTGKVFGIDLSRNGESLFINGLTLGFDVNR